MLQRRVQNPKREAHRVGPSSWYDYYAGYSDAFVYSVLDGMKLDAGAVVLDPWNGSGTTTQIARDRGVPALGYDINPAMVIVSKARILDGSVNQSLNSVGGDIVKKADRARSRLPYDIDPLEAWLDRGTARYLRRVEMAIHELLMDEMHYSPPYEAASLANVSSLTAFYYVALFRTVRDMLEPFRCSNPTWVKVPNDTSVRITASRSDVSAAFRGHVSNMARGVRDRAVSERQASIVLDLASSTRLPVADAAVGAVVSSPPYCTRIDYAVATRPELAVLGCDPTRGIAELRRGMIGTPVMTGESLTAKAEWGSACVDFLAAVESHGAKASASYYAKTFLQYFGSMADSLGEISRVLAEGGKCALVVQDSYYKDLHNNLPQILSQMASRSALNLVSQTDFPVTRSMAGLNTRSRRYRSTVTATESVLVFAKTA